MKIKLWNVLLITLFVAGCMAAQADSITVPNYSFESQVAGPPYMVDLRIDSWQKAAKPDYFDETAFGFAWNQTAGVFLDNYPNNANPLSNRDGNQGAYLLAFPGVSLFQSYGTTDWNHPSPSHDFDVTFEVGKGYTFTVGVLGKGGMADGTTLMLGLYYGDNPGTTVATGSAVYSAAGFPDITLLTDYTVTTPVVQAGDAWAGQKLGIEIINLNGQGAGYWDLDNVRLTSAVPEPSCLSLTGLGFAGLVAVRRARRGGIRK